MSSRSETPFIDPDARDGATGAFGRLLEALAPTDTLVGDGATPTRFFSRHPRNYDRLKEREHIYAAGGPISDFVDTRALMTYGTGVEFTTDAEDVTVSVPWSDDPVTVAEWLEHQFPLIDQTMIDRGVHTYVYGDAWPVVQRTRDGGVDQIKLLHPTTMDARWDKHGIITDLRQIVPQPRGGVETQPLNEDAVGHWFYKNETTGPLGESLLEQNWQEIEWYAQNQQQRANAIRLHGSPKYHVSVGSEGQSISDRLIRRIRNRFSSDDVDEKTNWVTGGDIEISELDAPGFDGMDSITETDIMKLASGFGVPIEWTNFGSAGLGTGTPAKSRIRKFDRQATAEQRRAAEQVKEWPMRWIVDEISPFPPGTPFDIQFGDVVTDRETIANWIDTVSDQLTDDEIRAEFGYDPLTDEQRREIEDRRETEQPDAGGGLFAQAADADVDAPDPLRDDPAAKRHYADGGVESGNPNGRALIHGEASADALTQQELVWSDLYENVLWSDEATERALFEFDPEEVPEFVIENLRAAVADGALFDHFETIPDYAASQVQDALTTSLEDGRGWSINSLTENIQDAVPGGVDRRDAERIARTETQALVNQAREEAYAEEFDLDEERFHWVGPDQPERNSEVCPAIKAAQPDEGLPLAELQDLVQSTAEEFGHTPRAWTPHINCRHSYTRIVE